MENVVLTPLEAINKFFSHTTNPDVMRPLIAEDATYISLNFDNPELKKKYYLGQVRQKALKVL